MQKVKAHTTWKEVEGDAVKTWLHKGNREADAFAKLGAKEIIEWIGLAHTAWKHNRPAQRNRPQRRVRTKLRNISAKEGGHNLEWHPLRLRCVICARTATSAKSIANIRREACRGPWRCICPRTPLMSTLCGSLSPKTLTPSSCRSSGVAAAVLGQRIEGEG